MSEYKRRARPLALFGIIGPIAWWLLIAINGAITPGYSHVSDFISKLGGIGAPYAIIQQFNFAVFGGSIIALAVGIHFWFGDGRRPRIATVLVSVFGVGVILAGVFPEHAAAPDSVTNVLHNIISMIAFLTGIGGVSLFTRRFGASDRWPTYQQELGATVFIVLVTFVVFMHTVFSESSFVGITQRLFIGVMTLWVVIQSIRLYRMVGESEQPGPRMARSIPSDTGAER